MFLTRYQVNGPKTKTTHNYQTMFIITTFSKKTVLGFSYTYYIRLLTCATLNVIHYNVVSTQCASFVVFNFSTQGSRQTIGLFLRPFEFTKAAPKEVMKRGMRIDTSCLHIFGQAGSSEQGDPNLASRSCIFTTFRKRQTCHVMTQVHHVTDDRHCNIILTGECKTIS